MIDALHRYFGLGVVVARRIPPEVYLWVAILVAARAASAELFIKKWCASPQGACELPQATAELAVPIDDLGAYVSPLADRRESSNANVVGWAIRVENGAYAGVDSGPVAINFGEPAKPIGLEVRFTENLCGALARPESPEPEPEPEPYSSRRYVAICGNPHIPDKQPQSPIVLHFSLRASICPVTPMNGGCPVAPVQEEQAYVLQIVRGPAGLTPPFIGHVKQFSPAALTCHNPQNPIGIRVRGGGFIQQTTARWNAGGMHQVDLGCSEIVSAEPQPGQFLTAEVPTSALAMDTRPLNKVTVVKNAGAVTNEVTSNPLFLEVISQSITLIKNVINDNGGMAGRDAFGLTIDGNPVNSGQQLLLPAGSHTINELGLAGYQFTGISGDPKCPMSLGGTVELSFGDHVTCTITNDDQPALLTLVKTVQNDDGGTATIADFQAKIDGQNVAWNTAVPVAPGVHAASETTIAGYQSLGWGNDCAPDGSVTLALGESKICTIINDDQPATITLVKHVVNDNGGTAGPNDFGLTINGNPVNSGQQTTLAAGSYVINELGLPGYQFSGISGDPKCPAALGGNVLLTVGEHVACTITNDDIAPALHLRKVVVNDNGGTATATDWTLTANGGAAGTLSGATPVDSGIGFKTGTYALSESGPSGYSASAWSCVGGTQSGSSITVGLGESATCTITNDDITGPSLHLRKVVVNDNGGTATVADFTLSASGPTPLSGTSPVDSGTGLSAGTYALSETPSAAATGKYSASAWSCVGGTQSGNNITVGPGESATCTITNDDIEPSLHLRKILVNDNGGTAAATDWTLTADGGAAGALSGTTPVDSGSGFKAGTYALSESGPPGYSASAWSCVGGTQGGSNITVGLGENATCTITNNDDIPPALHLRKVVVNDNGGTATAADFILSAAGPTPLSGVSPVDSGAGFSAGTYALSETMSAAAAGKYSASAWVCVGGTQSGSNITVGQGESATCTITNNDIAPKLTIFKQVINDDGGSKVPADFTINVTGTNANPPIFPGSASGTVVTLDAGPYSVDEALAPGYAKSLGAGCAGTISAGQAVDCTIVNNDVALPACHLTLEKIVINDDGGTAVKDNWLLSATGPSPISGPGGVSSSVSCGTYTLSEAGPGGYSTRDWLCAGGTQDGEQITLAAGESAVCTIVNDDHVPLPIDLTISKSLAGGNLTVGGQAAYTLSVSNVGPSATNAPVVVSDLLPAGLTVASLSGPGWTCAPAAGTCTRSDVLAAGSNFPPITLWVNVGGTACPGPVVNTATVAGGGDSNPLNNNATAVAPVAGCGTGGSPLSGSCDFDRGVTGGAYSGRVRARGGTPPYRYRLLSGSASLPPGLAFNESTGFVTGNAQSPGNYRFAVEISDGESETTTTTCSIEVAELLLSCPDTDATARSLYPSPKQDGQVKATGGRPPFEWSLERPTPTGLGIDSGTGVVTWPNPENVGRYSFTVLARDSEGATASIKCPVNVRVGIDCSELPPGDVGVGYKGNLKPFGSQDVTWVLSDTSTLNGFFRLDSFEPLTGELSGMPYHIGDPQLRVEAAPSIDPELRGVGSCPISIKPPAPPVLDPLDSPLVPSGPGTGPLVLTLKGSGFLPGIAGTSFDGSTVIWQDTSATPALRTSPRAEGVTDLCKTSRCSISPDEIVTTVPPELLSGPGTAGIFVATPLAPAPSAMRPIALVEVSCNLPDVTLQPYAGTIEVNGPGVLNLSIDSSALPPGLGIDADGNRIRVNGDSDASGELKIEPDRGMLQPGAQTGVSVRFPNLPAQNSEPGELTGTLRLQLVPSAGLPGEPGVTDSTFGFINGTKEIRFKIESSDASARGNAKFEGGAPEAAFQAGTVAGDIILNAALDSGSGLGQIFAFPVFVKDEIGNQLQPIPHCSIRVAPSGNLIQKVPQVAPAITAAGIERNGGEFRIRVEGYSTPRAITGMTVTFTPVPGGRVNPGSLQVPLNTLNPRFDDWFGGLQTTNGGVFHLWLRLVVSGNASAIDKLTVTLGNGELMAAPQPNSCVIDFRTGSPVPGQQCINYCAPKNCLDQ